jgi:hypothetical protein
VSWALLALVSTSCGGPSPTPTAAPPASRPITIEIERLPQATLDPLPTTAVCDPSPGQANPDAGEATLYCHDSLVLALRALRTATHEPIERIYLDLPVCRATRCTVDELSTGTVTAWVDSVPRSVGLDSRLTTVEVGVTDPEAIWPARGSSVVPPAARPALEAAPRELLERVPYPFCGAEQLGDPASVMACFRDAVLAGRAAEMLHNPGVEGDVTAVYRFDGHGAIRWYRFDNGAWWRLDGTMILGITPAAWSFELWDGTEIRL